jgi:membrane-associated protease RseP (regulator of RpoE activity)
MRTFLKSMLIITILAGISIAADNFGGLGISVYASKNGVNVVGVMPKSPAYNMGLQAGDLILSANGTELSTIEPSQQVGYLRGAAGSSINLVVERAGEKLSLSTKRVELSVQSLDSNDISAWYGKNKGLTSEEINHLASKKTDSGYEFLGVMQNGIPVVHSEENLKAENLQQFSMKKTEEKLPEAKEHHAKNYPFVNAKGAQVKWNKNIWGASQRK